MHLKKALLFALVLATLFVVSSSKATTQRIPGLPFGSSVSRIDSTASGQAAAVSGQRRPSHSSFTPATQQQLIDFTAGMYAKYCSGQYCDENQSWDWSAVPAMVIESVGPTSKRLRLLFPFFSADEVEMTILAYPRRRQYDPATDSFVNEKYYAPHYFLPGNSNGAYYSNFVDDQPVEDPSGQYYYTFMLCGPYGAITVMNNLAEFGVGTSNGPFYANVPSKTPDGKVHIPGAYWGGTAYAGQFINPASGQTVLQFQGLVPSENGGLLIGGFPITRNLEIEVPQGFDPAGLRMVFCFLQFGRCQTVQPQSTLSSPFATE